MNLKLRENIQHIIGNLNQILDKSRLSESTQPVGSFTKQGQRIPTKSEEDSEL